MNGHHPLPAGLECLGNCRYIHQHPIAFEGALFSFDGICRPLQENDKRADRSFRSNERVYLGAEDRRHIHILG